ncbi:MAG: hypothetical protein ABJB74_16040 [Gemmatimonas sp.]
MSQDLLAAIGARLEAQLKARDARSRTIEDTVKARVSLNPPAPFTLLADDTRQFGYVPTSAPIVLNVPDAEPEPESDVLSTSTPAETSLSAEDISAAIAPFAALRSAPAQLPNDSAAKVDIAPVPVMAAESTTDTASAAAAATAISYAMLADGTKQFGYAPPGAVVNVVANTTPAVSANLAVGATFRRKGTPSDIPMTVSRVGNGVVTAMYTDSEGTREMAFTPNQIELVTPATLVASNVTSTDATDVLARLAASNSAANSGSMNNNVATSSVASTAAARTNSERNAAAPTSIATVSDPIVANLVPNTTPPVSADFGVGATFRRHGTPSDIPMTVLRVGNGVVTAMYTDSEGTREMAFTPNQLDLVTSAPG